MTVGYALLLAAMATARLAELAWARHLTRRAAARGATPQHEPVFAAMVALHVTPFVLAPLEIAWRGHTAGAAVFATCTTGLVVLAGLRAWTLRSLGEMWNVRIVAPARVVATGPYRWVRHPNYAIVIGELLLLPLAGGAWLTAILVSIANALVLARRVRAEERLLAALPDYAQSMAGKPRFVPGLG